MGGRGASATARAHPSTHRSTCPRRARAPPSARASLPAPAPGATATTETESPMMVSDNIQDTNTYEHLSTKHTLNGNFDFKISDD